jgi:PAS domain S-box-containing protein
VDFSPDTISVLLVDDSPVASRIATHLERESGRFQVLTAGTVQEGRSTFETAAVDCLVCAYELPDGTGLDLLRRVRETEPDLPFLLHTDAGSETIASEAISAGVTDYLQREAGPAQYAVLAERIVDAVDRCRTEQLADTTERELHRLAAKSDDVLFVFDAEWEELRFVNGAYETVWGAPIAELETDARAFLDYVHPEDRESVRDVMESASQGTPETVEFRIVTGDGDRRLLRAEVKPVFDGGTVTRIVGISRDVTEREQREQAIRALHQTAREVWRSDSPQSVAETVVEAARDILDKPINAVHLYDGDSDSLRPAAATEQATEFLGEVPTFERGEGLAWEVFETGEPRRYDDVSTAPGRYNDETNARSELILPLTGHGVLHVGSPEAGSFDETDSSLMRTLVAHATSALDRLEHERRLTELQERTQRLMHTASNEATAAAAVEAVHDILRSPSGGVHLLSEDGDALPPTAVVNTYREGFEAPTYRRDAVDDPISDLVWEVFEAEEPVVIDDVMELEAIAEKTPARSAMIYPLGEYGVFVVTSGQPHAFDDADETYVELVATSLTTALERVQRETNLQERERALERQNERLEQFTDIVSHDLRNPLNVAEGRLGLLREECDSEHIEPVERAHGRMEELITDLLTLAREGESATDTEPIDVAALAEDCWRTVETGDATLNTQIDRTILADETRLRQLFENLVRNSVEHGAPGPRPRDDDSVEHGSTDSRPGDRNGGEHGSTNSRNGEGNTLELQESDVTVTVGGLPDGFYVADDGPGIPPDVREAVFDTGYSTTDDGTGFGLSIVQRAVDAHGWEINVTEGADGGARFEITGVDAVDG